MSSLCDVLKRGKHNFLLACIIKEINCIRRTDVTSSTRIYEKVHTVGCACIQNPCRYQLIDTILNIILEDEQDKSVEIIVFLNFAYTS